ncbi:Hypothetical Protein FCC1311_074422 [Hondaea fermentalgiana]|uniref:Uncharacterized protein n=1 Tax=Hondaea fermentalgiana TaxID=2315210 RepID=A0A2R5GS89_9STRA|nr:Hypothetical Protein FCC1311_074422 [Hondaea fermentalgiana]|eukprot:GBG31221.1 Hypothetical Protein FCC1311_074422 [Hondaea fermentalgiana]
MVDSTGGSKVVMEVVGDVGDVGDVGNAKEKSSLGGILRRRVPEEDAVQSLRAEPALEVVATLQEKATLQTSFLLAKQKQVYLAGREAAKRAEDADIAHYVAVDKFSRECAAFNDVGPLLEDVQRACDLVRATVVQCAQLDELLCERLGESPAPALTFPALTSATAGSS